MMAANHSHGGHGGCGTCHKHGDCDCGPKPERDALHIDDHKDGVTVHGSYEADPDDEVINVVDNNGEPGSPTVTLADTLHVDDYAHVTVVAEEVSVIVDGFQDERNPNVGARVPGGQLTIAAGTARTFRLSSRRHDECDGGGYWIRQV